MKTLGVCGDSFMASMQFNDHDLDNGYGKHFTDLLAKRLKMNIITFAKSGSSNQAIRLQIDEILKQTPDFIIIGTTTPERVEIPIYEQSFDENDGVYNIYHTNNPNVSAKHPNFSKIKPKMLSTTIHNVITEDHSKFFSKKDIEVFKSWSEIFFDSKWKRQQDTWILSDGLRKIRDSKIDFICINGFLNPKDLEYLGDNIIQHDSELNPWNYCNPDKMPKYWFHTGLEEQEILAEKWYEFIKDRSSVKPKFI